MDYERAVVDFLARPDNLPIALEVAKRIEKVKDQIQIQFWQQYRDVMGQRLQAASLTERWQMQLTPERKLLDPWAKCHIGYSAPNRQALHLDVTLEVENPRIVGYLYYGLRWSEQHSEAPDSARMTEIMNVLKMMGLSLKSKSNWWVMYINLEHRLREEQFLLRYVAEPDQVIGEISERVWTFFAQMREPLETLNGAIANDRS